MIPGSRNFPSWTEDVYEDAMDASAVGLEGADDVLGRLKKIQEERRKAEEAAEKKTALRTTEIKRKKIYRLTYGRHYEAVCFRRLADLTRSAHVLAGFYSGEVMYSYRSGGRTQILLFLKQEPADARAV